MEKTNESLYTFINRLAADTYALIKLKYGSSYVEIVEGNPEELLNALTVNMYDIYNYNYKLIDRPNETYYIIYLNSLED